MRIRGLRQGIMFKVISCVQAAAFIFSSFALPVKAYAQSVMELPAPGAMVDPSQAFAPVMLRAVKIDPAQPLVFDFIVDSGNTKADQAMMKAETQKLVKYFLATLTVPEKDLWVNLSPYEQDRIATDAFGGTQMGRDLLAQDYVLKQLASSLIDPSKDLGKEFWARVYAKASETFGATDIPMDTFNKVWIMPDKAQVYEMNGTAIIGESRMKVLMEEDYLALQKNTDEKSVSGTNKLASQIMRAIVIPEIEKEVNTGKNFAPLRQVYQALVLATWYKNNLKESLLAQVYADKNKVAGVDTADKGDKEKIYQRYIQAYKQGVFNYIKEEKDPLTNDVTPRKYFSGGWTVGEEFGKKVANETKRIDDSQNIPDAIKDGVGELSEVNVALVKPGVVENAQLTEAALSSDKAKSLLPFFNGDAEELEAALVGWQQEFAEKLNRTISLDDLLLNEEFFELLADDSNARDGRIRPRALVHKTGDKHRDARIFIVNKDTGAILLQHRDNTKDVDPELWADSVGGHTGIGETYRQNAAREIKEEMGIEVEGKSLSFLGLFDEENKGKNAKGEDFWNKSIYGAFVGVIDAKAASQIKANKEDGIDEIDWISFDELKARLKANPEQFVPWLREKLQDPEFLARVEESIKSPEGKNFALLQENAVAVNDVLAAKKKLDGMFLDGETPENKNLEKFAQLTASVPSFSDNVSAKVALLGRVRGAMGKAAALTSLAEDINSFEALKAEIDNVIVKNTMSKKKADSGLLLTVNGIIETLPIIHGLKTPEAYSSNEALQADIKKAQDFIYIERGRVYRSPEVMQLLKASQQALDGAYFFYLNKQGLLPQALSKVEAAFKENFDHNDLPMTVNGWAAYNSAIEALQDALKGDLTADARSYAQTLLFLSKMKQVDLVADNILSHPDFQKTMKKQDLRKFILLSGIPGGGKGTVGDRVKRYWGQYIKKATLFHERGPRPSEKVNEDYYNRLSAQLQGAISDEMMSAAGIVVGASVYNILELAGVFKKVEEIAEFDGEKKFYYFVDPGFKRFSPAVKKRLEQSPDFKGDVGLFEKIIQASQQIAEAVDKKKLAIATVNNQKQGLALDNIDKQDYYFHLTADGSKAISYVEGGTFIMIEGLRSKLSGPKITFLEGGRDWQLQIKTLLGDEYTSVFIMPMSEQEIQQDLDTMSVKAAYEAALAIHVQDVARDKAKDPARTDFKTLAAESAKVGAAAKETGDAGLTEEQRKEFVIMRQTILRIHKRNIDDEGGKMTSEKDMQNRAKEAALQVLNAKGEDKDNYKVILVNAFQDTVTGYYKMANEMVVDLGYTLFNSLVSIGYEKDGQEKVDNAADLGGIDFNPAALNLTVLRTGTGIKVQVDPALIERIKAEGVDGFAPLIINIVPIKSMIGALGLAPAQAVGTAS